uniref:Uncharacterized protein n=1 Tax=viral metagenome TaxID=1070528 RepID=A0A6M3L141_9ZZZZ
MKAWAIVDRKGKLQEGTESDFLIYRKKTDAKRVCNKDIAETVCAIVIIIKQVSKRPWSF